MPKPKSKNSLSRKQKRLSEVQEIQLLKSWIDSGKPDSGSNPLSLSPLPENAPVGRVGDSFSTYAGCTRFDQLPLSQKTKDGLSQSKYVEMTDIQRASLPHSLCGRDILGAARTGSGKTLAFVVPILEKLYRERWGPEDGVGSIIISPSRELASQLFDVLKSVGKHHGFSAGLLIGGRKDVDMEKECVNELNILVCTPGRLLQHMDETTNFDCSQLQVLVLDEADRILDEGFKKAVNAILSQLPKYRQTLLFSATQTKRVQDLARLSLKDPEYLSVHEDSTSACPIGLEQRALIVPLDQKLDMLWSFIRTHLNSRVLVFLSSCKQVKFVFEAFRKLRPGTPLMCLHGRMKQEKRMAIYSQFCEKRSVLFSTDVAARGLDFNKAVDWVVQVDCPEDVATYIHRVGRTARYVFGGKSVVFLMPSEMEMCKKLEAAKVNVKLDKVKPKFIKPISETLASLLVKYPGMQQQAQRAFITYLRSIHLHKDKEVFDVMKLPIDEFSASLGLPMTPKLRFLKQRTNNKKTVSGVEQENCIVKKISKEILSEKPDKFKEVEEQEEEDKGFVLRDTSIDAKETGIRDIMPENRVSKKKKLKINLYKPIGTRVVFDEEGNTLLPLATLADTQSGSDLTQFDEDAKKERNERYKKLREQFKQHDKEDKALNNKRLRSKRMKEKEKLKRERNEEDEDVSGSDGEANGAKNGKKMKIYFDDNDDGDDDDDNGYAAEQEALALKLLSSMHE